MIAKALIATKEVENWLKARDTAASVKSVHRRSCYLINSSGRYLALAMANIGPGPFTMVIGLEENGPADLRDLINVGAKIDWTKNNLLIGQLIIRTDQYIRWDSTVNWRKFDRFADQTWLSILGKYVKANAPNTSIASLLSDQPLNPFFDRAKEGWLLVQHGLEIVSLSPVLEGVNHLAGLGSGLTPAGDDFLLGVIYGLWMNLTDKLAYDWSVQIHEVAASQTTSLSAYWLEVAAIGEASKPWHDLLSAIYDMNKSYIQSAAQSLSNYGHTSGFDALSGFILASTCLMKRIA